ncbi:hypothetical protein [Halorubrum distributum]|uniref:Uncharacterized protein n=1 Tax=Halorubrum distributum TaxID=29283 RepID=A0A6B1IIJ7_9EURY|nr:hypothetical protein [Halorubrum terrestre]MYL67030.1 hypothetical protein [Halorubrum terrestre]
MTLEFGVDDVTALLLDERKYDSPLREKEFHKLLYFIKQELEEEGIDANIPYYWYRYGTVTPTSESSVTVEKAEDGGSQVICPVEPDTIDVPEDELDQVRDVVQEVLLRYYQIGGLEPLTDLMYEDAPYEVQIEFRQLDKQLRTAADNHPDLLDDGYDKDDIRRTLSRVVKMFPTSEFPHQESDLYLWYTVMSTELDQTDQFYSVNEMLSLCDAFWTVFMIEVAQQEHSDLTVKEVRDAISDDVDSYQKQMRARLENKEREQTKFGAQLEQDEVVRDAQDAVAEALVGFAPSQ